MTSEARTGRRRTIGSADGHFSIGNVAERIGLRLRSIRYYEEVGLVPPSGRTKGAHHLYSQGDIERLLLIMKMKPLDFSLEEMGQVLSTLDQLHDPDTTAAARVAARDRLKLYEALVTERLRWLQERLIIAREFRQLLTAEIATGSATDTDEPANLRLPPL